MSWKDKIFGRAKEDQYFFEYFEKGNSVERLGRIYILCAIVLAGLFTVMIYKTDIPKIYFTISLITLFLVPAIAFLSIYLKNKNIHVNIIYIMLGYFIFVSYLAFQDLVYFEFETIHFIAYFTLFAIGCLAMQMILTRLIYILVNLGLIFYGYLYVDEPDVPFGVMASLLFLFSSVAMVVIISRSNLIERVQAYSIYLKSIVNNSHVGFILFKVNEKKIEIVDINKEALKTFNLEDATSAEKLLESKFYISELLQISLLVDNQTFTKQIEIVIEGVERNIEINVSSIQFKNSILRVANIIDISERITEQKIIAKREKKYRNLYNKNLAGVYTLNPDMLLIDYNDTFFGMFGKEFTKGKIFSLYPDVNKWKNDIVQSIKRDEGKNFHVKYVNKAGEVKWYNFNWFEEKFSENFESTVIDLTETYKVNEALRHNETKFRQIYSESNDCILLLKEDKIVDVNKTGIQLFGISKIDLMNYNLWELSQNLSEESRREYVKFKNRLNITKNIKFDWNFIGNGQVIECEISFVDIVIEDEHYTQCVIRDLTELNQYQRELEQTTANLESILENTPEGIFIISEDYQLQFCNPKAYEMMQLSPQETIDFKNLFYQKDQLKYDKMLQDIHETKEIQEKQLHLVKADKNLLEVEISIVQTVFANKEAYLHILKDVSVQNKLSKEMLRAEVAEESNKRLNKEISERIKAERNAQEQYLRTKAIFESSSNTLLLTLDKNLNIITFNSHSKDYFNQKVSTPVVSGESIIKIFEEIYEPNYLRLFRRELNQIINGKYKQLELKLKKKNQEFWLDLFLNPIFDIEGRVIEISMVAHDVTDKKANEIELKDSLKEKEILLKEIHHRVKNNLQIISSILNIQSSFIQDPKTLEILEDSRNRIRSMAIIHENLYHTANFSSINFSNYLTILSTNLISSYSTSEDAVKLTTKFEKVELILDQAIPCGLIINELVTNALKYAFDGSKVGELFVGLKLIDNHVHVTVKDNGVGLPPDFKYEESDSLGLQLVITLVEQLDGKININSNGGTEFNIIFEKEKL